MFSRRFSLIFLCSALLCGVSTHFAFAEVVHAYRTPSEADLQWLRGNSTALIPSVAEPSKVVQAAYIPARHVNTLVPGGNPCRPVGLPEPSIPPAPSAVQGKAHTGLVSDEDEAVYMISIVPDSASAIVQMSGDRLAPPSEVPKEHERVAMLTEDTVARLPMKDDRELPLDTSSFSFADTQYRSVPGCAPCDEVSCGNGNGANDFCACFTCIVCGDHRKNRKSGVNCCSTSDDADGCNHLCPANKNGETFLCVPNMIGSSAWLMGHYVGVGGSVFSSPTMLLSRPNVVEHFNASVQNRIWADYRHWSNAVSFNGENRAVEQYSFGIEKKILRGTSVEWRIPLFYQYGSKQDDGSTSVELGNMTVFAKQILRQGPRWTFVGGVGASLPTAEDWRPGVGVLKNNVYYLVSFLGAQWHPNISTFGHFVVQADVPIEKNELFFGSERIKVDGQHVIRAGAQLGRWIYRADHGKRPCRFGLFTEIDYAVATDRSAYWADTSNTMYVSADTRKSTLSAAIGMPMVFGKLTCMNTLILPISGNNRPFCAAYSFALSRQF